jgi:hypothetical protein
MSDVEDTGFAGMRFHREPGLHPLEFAQEIASGAKPPFRFNEAQVKLYAMLSRVCACEHMRSQHITHLYPCDGACSVQRCYCSGFVAAAEISP